jgi:uncharacterized protein DUF955
MMPHYSGETKSVVPPLTQKQITAVAKELREKLGLEDKFAPDLIDILEFQLPELFPSFRLTIVGDAKLGPSVLACSRGDPPEIVLSESTYRRAIGGNARARFTLAHELGHVMLCHIGEFRRDAGGRRLNAIGRQADPEWQANQFAAAFLMPEHIVRKFNNAKDVSRFCKVSEAAASVRMIELVEPPKSEKVAAGFQELLARLKSGIR